MDQKPRGTISDALRCATFDAAWRTTQHNQKPTEKEQEESQ